MLVVESGEIWEIKFALRFIELEHFLKRGSNNGVFFAIRSRRKDI